jgi:hypothetical protein
MLRLGVLEVLEAQLLSQHYLVEEVEPAEVEVLMLLLQLPWYREQQ